jgi:hypothetical protein
LGDRLDRALDVGDRFFGGVEVDCDILLGLRVFELVPSAPHRVEIQEPLTELRADRLDDGDMPAV